MNKIKLFRDQIRSTNIDDSIILDVIPRNEFFDVTTINLKIVKDTELLLEYNTKRPVKLNIKIEVDKDVNFTLKEYRYGTNFKVQYLYYLKENSNSKIYKFYDVSGIKEMSIIYLQEKNANIDYFFKTIATGCEKYSMRIYHNAPNTNSNINNGGVNVLNGNLSFSISSFVNEGNKECDVYQNSRIINLTENKCQIYPNLFIDEYNVNANHAANIGTFDESDIFYLMSRGISRENAVNMLINGYMIKDMPEYFINRIKRNLIKYRG